jgi:hypothetical protein
VPPFASTTHVGLIQVLGAGGSFVAVAQALCSYLRNAHGSRRFAAPGRHAWRVPVVRDSRRPARVDRHAFPRLTSPSRQLRRDRLGTVCLLCLRTVGLGENRAPSCFKGRPRTYRAWVNLPWFDSSGSGRVGPAHAFWHLRPV